MEEVFTSSTQYGDIKGDITIDGQISGNLHEFSKDNNIDTDKYFPIGIEIYIGENKYQNIDIIAIDKEAIGLGSKYENIKIYLEENDKPDVKKINIPNATLDDYLKFCKRFSISATSIPELMNKTINIT